MGEAKRRRDIGATGEYPDGMIRQDDEGALRFAVSDADSRGNIHIDFGTPVSWIAMPKEQAMQFGLMLLKKAGAKKVEVSF